MNDQRCSGWVSAIRLPVHRVWIVVLIGMMTACVSKTDQLERIILIANVATQDYDQSHQPLSEPYLLVVNEAKEVLYLFRNGEWEEYETENVEIYSGPNGFTARDFHVKGKNGSDVFTILREDKGHRAYLMTLDTIYSGYIKKPDEA